MRLFHLEYHGALAHDLADVLGRLGHQVDTHLFGNESRRFPLRRTDGPFNGLTIKNWREWTPADFCAANRDRLAGYDAYLVGYPPIFARFFEPLGKPIIVFVAIRFDWGVSDRPNERTEFILWLRRMIGERRLHVVANSIYEADHFAQATGHLPVVIPNWCGYLNLKWRGGGPPMTFDHARRMKSGRYRYEDVARAGYVQHIPYNASVMSFYEHYTMEAPIVVPTQDRLMELVGHGQAMQEIAFSGQPLTVHRDDISLTDFYNALDYPGVIQSDEPVAATYPHLNQPMMAAANARRFDGIMRLWTNQLILAKR